MTDNMEMAVQFFQDDKAIQTVSDRFCQALENVLQGKQSSLSKLDSCMKLPSGNEIGVYLALDFGGTNVRVSRVRLMGKRCYVIEKRISHPLRLEGKYDYLSAETTKEELFDFLAACIEEIALPNVSYKLGHTFSYATQQQGPDDALFLAWAKEVKIKGMEGVSINALLRQALHRRGLDMVEPVALVNDTTAALLAASYRQEGTQIAVICGTGFNICYYEPSLDTIINLEAGCFDGVDKTKWDKEVDAVSEKPGDHYFEKMVGGGYLGDILHHCVMDYYGTSAIRQCSAEAMNAFISLDEDKEGQLYLGRMWQRIITEQDVQAMRALVSSIFVRSAQLAGGACAGVLKHIYPDGDLPEQIIAVEGSIMGKVMGSQTIFNNSLRLCFSVDKEGWTRPVPIQAQLIQDGPSVGAAVAAAMNSSV